MPKMDKTITVRGQPVEITLEGHHLPRTLILYEPFKVEGGLVTGVEALMRYAPLGADVGWPASHPRLALLYLPGPAEAVAAGSCARAPLRALARE